MLQILNVNTNKIADLSKNDPCIWANNWHVLRLRFSNYSSYFNYITKRFIFSIKVFLGVVFNPKYKDDTLRFTNPSFFRGTL